VCSSDLEELKLNNKGIESIETNIFYKIFTLYSTNDTK
jgi:hypothetical protein